jgi:hypothetical protein
MGFGAFWGNALNAGRFLNPFGILFLVLGVIIWFKWNSLAGVFASAREEVSFPVILGSAITEELSRTSQQRRMSGSNSSSS